MLQRAAPQHQQVWELCGQNRRRDSSEKWQTHVLNITQKSKPLMRWHPPWQPSSFLPKDSDEFNNCAVVCTTIWQKVSKPPGHGGGSAACIDTFVRALLGRIKKKKKGGPILWEAFSLPLGMEYVRSGTILTPHHAWCSMSARRTWLFSHTRKFAFSVLHQLLLPPFLLNPDLKGRSGRFGWEVVYSPSSLVRKWTLVNAC